MLYREMVTVYFLDVRSIINILRQNADLFNTKNGGIYYNHCALKINDFARNGDSVGVILVGSIS
jgi:hypothetical protein